MDRKRAIKFHCVEKPDETPTTLYYKSLKGRPNAGNSKAALAKAEAKRKDANKGHDIFLMPAEKSYSRSRQWPYCRTCLFALHGTTAGRICKDNLEMLKNNKKCLSKRRLWWKRTKQQNKPFTDEFIRRSGWTEQEIDDFFKVHEKATWSAKHWAQIKQQS